DGRVAPQGGGARGGGGRPAGALFAPPPLPVGEARLHGTGASGGYCDGGDCEGDAAVEAGWPFFGQFVAHDITADRSPLRVHTDLESLRNMRSPRANLGAGYGGGPGRPPRFRRP